MISSYNPMTEARNVYAKTEQDADTLADLDNYYTQLALLQVDLDDDPVAYGPNRLQGKVAACRSKLSACENMFTALSQQMLHAGRDARVARVAFDLAVKTLLSSDPEVRSGKGVSDREAMATVKLQTEWLKLQNLESRNIALDALLGVIKAKRADLKDVSSRLRDQISLCADELGLGRRWGARTPAAMPDLTPGVTPPPPPLEEGGIESLLRAMDDEIESTEDQPSIDSDFRYFDATDVKAQAPLVDTASDDEIDSALDGIVLPNTLSPDSATLAEDVDDILSLLD